MGNINHTIIIAEAGVNHNGDISLAKKLVDAAKSAGADIVKFQTFNPSKLVSKSAQMADYQKENIGKEASQKDMLSKLALSEGDFIELKSYCDKVGIEFLSTPFDMDSVDFLAPLVSFWKIPSGEITNYPYLVKLAKSGKPLVMSTGMSDLTEVKAAVDLLEANGASDITLLQCNTMYPTPYSDVNLKAMLTMRNELHLPVGYSDHTKGIEIPIAAVAMGATIIEKHFTLSRKMEGPDHKASLEPDELNAMVDAIRNVEAAIGTGEKKLQNSEVSNVKVVRKSIVANCHIKKGERFTSSNLTTKRPATGLSPMRWNEVIGKTAPRDFEEDELITLE